MVANGGGVDARVDAAEEDFEIGADDVRDAAVRGFSEVTGSGFEGGGHFYRKKMGGEKLQVRGFERVTRRRMAFAIATTLRVFAATGRSRT